MFSGEFRINTMLIGYLHGIRMSTFPDRDGKYEYQYSYYLPEKSKNIEGTIKHRYGDGVEKLFQLIITDIIEKKKELKDDNPKKQISEDSLYENYLRIGEGDKMKGGKNDPPKKSRPKSPKGTNTNN